MKIVIKHVALVLSLAAAISILASACGGESGPGPTPTLTPRVQVVTTTAILADFVRNVGGDLVNVRSIVPPEADVHSFQPTPGTSITIGEAALIVSNGFDLDSFLDPIFESARSAGSIMVVAAEGLEAMPIVAKSLPDGDHEGDDGGDRDDDDHEGDDGDDRDDGDHEGDDDDHEEDDDDHEEDGEDGHAHLEGDPHFWQNPQYAIHYVERIRDGLVLADPENAQTYRESAAGYIRQLEDLDEEISRTLAQVPQERRRLVTFHDAFGYFAGRYGWRVSAFVSDDASDVTPGDIVTVMEQVREEGIPAVFAEPQFSPDVMEQAARDAGVSVGTIYSDTLGDDVASYIDMMRFNAGSLVDNLR